jgi:hypothetical protein
LKHLAILFRHFRISPDFFHRPAGLGRGKLLQLDLVLNPCTNHARYSSTSYDRPGLLIATVRFTPLSSGKITFSKD